MKQAQAMQDNLKKAQEELATIEVEGESGAGLVKVTMTCKHDVKRVTIDPSLLADDKDMLEDLVAAAFNAARAQAEEVSAGEDGQAHRRHAGPAARHEAARSDDWTCAGRSRRSRRCVEALRRLPGRGRKSAQRMAFHLLQHDREGAQRAGAARWSGALHAGAPLRALPHLHRGTRSATSARDPQRDATQAVRGRDAGRPGRARAHRRYRGLYFVLMGKLSPLDGIGPKDIGAREAVRARRRRPGEEVILATNFTAEGEATAHVIGEALQAARP